MLAAALQSPQPVHQFGFKADDMLGGEVRKNFKGAAGLVLREQPSDGVPVFGGAGLHQHNLIVVGFSEIKPCDQITRESSDRFLAAEISSGAAQDRTSSSAGGQSVGVGVSGESGVQLSVGVAVGVSVAVDVAVSV